MINKFFKFVWNSILILFVLFVILVILTPTPPPVMPDTPHCWRKYECAVASGKIGSSMSEFADIRRFKYKGFVFFG